MTSKKPFSTEQKHPQTTPITTAWTAAGLDLALPLDLAAWNRGADPAERLPDFGRAAPLALLVANTRALWPRLLDALRQDPDLRAHPDPLDTYVEAAITTPLGDFPHPSTTHFAHHLDPAPIPIQRIAQRAGLPLAPCHLNIHPHLGPWIALRAIVVFDLDGPTEHLTHPNPCTTCPKPCLPPLNRALTAAQTTEHDPLTPHWPLWLAVRDACPIGRDHRYGARQIRYHYSKEKEALEADPESQHSPS